MKTCLQPHPLRIKNSPQSASCFTTKAGLKWEGVTCRRVSGEGKKQEQRLDIRISFNLIPHRLTQALHLPCVCAQSLGFRSHVCEIQAEIKCVFHSCVDCPLQLYKTSPLFSQETEGITSTPKLHIGPFKFSSVAFCLPTHACMQTIPVSDWRWDIHQSTGVAAEGSLK